MRNSFQFQQNSIQCACSRFWQKNRSHKSWDKKDLNLIINLTSNHVVLKRASRMDASWVIHQLRTCLSAPARPKLRSLLLIGFDSKSKNFPEEWNHHHRPNFSSAPDIRSSAIERGVFYRDDFSPDVVVQAEALSHTRSPINTRNNALTAIIQDAKHDNIERPHIAQVWNVRWDDRGRRNLPGDRKRNQWSGAGGETKYIDEFDLRHHRSDCSSAHNLHCVNRSNFLNGSPCRRLKEHWHPIRYSYIPYIQAQNIEKIAWNFYRTI